LPDSLLQEKTPLLAMIGSACPTCGCTCGGVAGGVLPDQFSIKDMQYGKNSQADLINISSSRNQPQTHKAALSVSVSESQDQPSYRAGLKNNTQQLGRASSTGTGESEEFHSMKSLLNKSYPSQKFHTPPPVPPVNTTPPLTYLPPTPLFQPNYATPPPTTSVPDLVHSLSSSEVSVDAKKKALLSLAKNSLTEALVYQLFSVDTGDLLAGVKYVVEQFKDNNTKFRREVLILALQFFNQCMSFTMSSGRLRSLLWNKSIEITRTFGVGGLSLIQSLVPLSDPVQGDARLPAQLCAEVSAELRSLSVGVMIGKCSSGLDNAEQAGRWARICLGTNRVEVTSSKMVQDMFKVMDLCFVQSGQEVRMDRLLVEKYPEQMWSVRHPVREERGADWSSITVVKMLPSGHVMVYTDMEWQDRLVRLEQELQEIPRSNIPTAKIVPGLMSCVTWSDVQLASEEMPPLVRCQLARALVLSLTNQGMVEVFLPDHGCRGAVPAGSLSPLPQHLSSLSPCIVIARLQGVLPTPAIDLLSTSIQALATLCNSRTVSSLLNRPSLTAPRIISQLISSPDLSLSTPALSVLYMMITTVDSRKHLLLSPVCLQLVIPSLLHLLVLPTLASSQLPKALECLFIIFTNLQPNQVQPFYNDGKLVHSLNQAQVKLGESQYTDFVKRLLSFGGLNVQGNSTQTARQMKTVSHSKSDDIPKSMNSGASLLSMVDGAKVGRGGAQVEQWIVEQDRIKVEEDKRVKEESMRIYNEQISKAKVDNKTAECPFIPLQVQSLAVKNKVSSTPPSQHPVMATSPVSPNRSADTASVYMSANNSLKVSPVKAGSVSAALPSWLGMSKESDSSSDSDSDNPAASSLPPWLATQAGPEASQRSQDLLKSSSSESISANNVPRLPPWLAQENGAGGGESDSSDRRGASCSPGGWSGTESGLEGGLATGERRISAGGVWPNMSKVQEIVQLGRDMTETQGIGVEFWEVEKITMLCPTTLSVLLCGMLNSGSGVVWAGVGKDGKVKGIQMGRGERDKIRQMLDRVCSTNMNPRVGARVVDIDFVRVEGGEELWLVKYTVKVHEEVLYRVRNLGNKGYREGVYARQDTGPDYTEFVSEEMLESIQGLDL